MDYSVASAIVAIGLGLIVIPVFLFYMVFCKHEKRYERLPGRIEYPSSESPYKEVHYTVVRMKFVKWQRLFELDPEAFEFVELWGNTLSHDNVMKNDYRKAHPFYGDEGLGKYYLVAFSSFDCIRYYFYQWRIKKILSAIPVQEISMAIVGDIRAKIDKIAEEANQEVQDALDIQKKIVLRLTEDEEARKATRE